MFCRLVPLLLGALCATGCVPVTEPVGDIDGAEPDKALVGKWTTTDSNGTAKVLDVTGFTVETPGVKGNPKGLMRANTTGNSSKSELWFYTATVGKHTYAIVLLGAKDGEGAKFSKEGEYAKWKKVPKQQYFVFRYARDGDKLTLDCGDYDKFKALMKDEKITGDGGKYFEYFDTPAGWLDKYLAKTGPDKIYNGTNNLILKREKK